MKILELMVRLKGKKYVLIFGLLLPIVSFAQESKLFTCNATLADKIFHQLKIEVSGGKVTGFSYTTVASNGNTCELEAKRNTKKSDWKDDEQSTVISMRALGQDAGTVRIQKGDNFYKLTILTPLDLSCGLQGYIAPVAILHINNKTCELRK